MLGKMAKEIPGILKAEANDSQDNGEVGFQTLLVSPLPDSLLSR